MITWKIKENQGQVIKTGWIFIKWYKINIKSPRIS